MPFDGRRLPPVLDFANSQESWSEFLLSIESYIFQELNDPDPDVVGRLVGHIISLPLLQPSSTSDDIDALAEVTNSIAAAAAIQSRSYDPLVSLVLGLFREGQKINPIWRDLPYQIAVACLLRFPFQTNLFLLKLLNGGILDLYVIYKFLKNQHSESNCVNTPTFLYFLPELYADEKSREFSTKEWKKLLPGGGESSLFNLFAPKEYPTTQDLTKADWGKFLELRAEGKNPSALLEAIRTDSVGDFLPFVAQHDYQQRIPYSLYEQYFHFEYEVTIGGDNKAQMKVPKIVDAIALLGARSCFRTLLSEEHINKEQLLGDSARAIIACGSATGFLTAAIEAGMMITGRSLEPAVRFHDNDALTHLLDSQEAQITDDAIAAALVYANYAAFEIFHSEGELKRAHFREGGKPGLLHFIAKGNAITALKLVLSTEKVDTAQKTSKKRGFLHWAANYGAYNVAHFWTEKLNVGIGLDVVDDQGQTPVGIAYARVPYRRPDGKKTPEERNPLYGLLSRTSERCAEKAIAGTD
jgi:hypothetical protein